MNPVLLYVIVVVFIGTLIRSVIGFGEALIAVPLLAFCIPVEVAVPLTMLISITVAGVIVAQDWRKIHIRSARWLVIATLLGIPLGLVFLKISSDKVVKAVLGVIIVVFSVYALIWRSRLHLKSDSRFWLFGCGFFAGVLGGAYGMNGPPLAIYGAMRRWSPQHFRATLQGYFLPASIIGMAGYWLVGIWTPAVTRYYLLSLPATLLAIFLGRAVNNRLAGEGFLRCIYLMLIGVGMILLFQALHA
jgi:uncharacterized membrane protein YfcA